MEMVIDWMLLQSANARWPMVCTELPKVSWSAFAQPRNASWPMCMTVGGRCMAESEEQPQKAWSGTVLKEDGNDASRSEEQPLKQPVPRVDIEASKSNACRRLQFSKA